MDPTASKSSAVPETPLSLTEAQPKLLLLVYIHGFKGTDQTFQQFPQRLEHILSGMLPHVTIESIVFPSYEV